MLTDDTFFSSISELAALLRARRVSPVELTEGYLARLEKFGPRLGAVASVMRATALKEARVAEREIRAGRYRGPLHGVPYGAKDLLATRDAPTTWGAAPYKDQQFKEDATVVRKLREAGAVLVAKLAMVELAGGMGYNEASASLTGACRTPWNTEFWSGGSSSGPGAAVAAGLVAFAIGSETSGSIITPAAFCGIAGLRPTYGRVSRHGAMALSWTLDKLGPMCRTAEDCGIVFQAIAGRDPLDASSKDDDISRLPHAVHVGFRKRLRIAVMKDSYEKAQPAVRDNFLRSLDALRKTADVLMDVALPDFPYGAAVGTIVDAEGASAFRELIESGRVQELASPTGRVGGYAASLVTAVDYLHAMRLRAPARRAWSEMFTNYDALVAPSRSSVAYPINKTFDQAYPNLGAASPIGACNLVGVPAISVPNGFGENNLPTGIQFIGPAWEETNLIKLAVGYQRATDWHKRRPDLA
ncbi:MAG: aspartyl-tRNA(Asn)/glutamyl-tRNA(Gln) amidotransferase subunit [Blastocatellia bacterium]|jgi:aspartyl-tRNA(Asn)/glutamyl-tRNA(Gln) amidotransferase subunit A|nr:aspartyl-tRNA(Asn)/glutamyl-tRNA(Gln) amidotransferase subunit [Blastocatellia bacterium]